MSHLLAALKLIHQRSFIANAPNDHEDIDQILVALSSPVVHAAVNDLSDCVHKQQHLSIITIVA